MKKLSKTLAVIAVVLMVIAGLLFVNFSKKNQQDNAGFYTIDYNSIASLDNSGVPYYLLVCDLHEEQCKNAVKLLKENSVAKYNIYYVDTTNYSEMISNQNLSDDERMEYVLLFKEHMGKINVDSIPSFQLRIENAVLGTLAEVRPDGFTELTNNELTQAIKQLNQKVSSQGEN